MPILYAALPLLCVLVGMAVLHSSAVRAGAAGLAVALVLALLPVAPFAAILSDGGTLLGALGGTLAEALFSTFSIVWIIFPALALYAFQSKVGAIDRIRAALTGLTDDRRLQALLIGWFFCLFIEGAAGFGTPVALAAPLLLGLGYSPVRAVTMALLGHATGVSFAAIGTPTLAQLELADVDAVALSAQLAILHALFGWLLLFAMVRLADDGPLTRRDVIWTLTAGLCFFAPFLVFAFFAGPELPTLAGALLGTALFVALLRRAKERGPSAKTPGSSSPTIGELGRDLAPYLLLVVLVLATRLIGPIEEAVLAPTLAWELDGRFSGAMAPLHHPGTLLWLAIVLAGLSTGRLPAIAPAAGDALRRLAMVSLALVIMLTLSRLMVHTGMIAELASAAATTGPIWPLLAPAVGVLGTFISGSATASNILFTELQVSAARTLDLPVVQMVAAQGLGSAIGNVLAPHNIIAGAATVGIVGREGEVLSRTIYLGLIYTLLGGFGILILVWL